MKKMIAVVAITILSMFTVGCAPRMLGPALFGAAVVGTAVGAAAVHHAVHHAHYHHYNCGCPRHWEGGRWSYYYQGGYEYYDRDAGVWYRY
jgi:hypothetical protein